MPKVSVIVPVYNVEEYVGECLASIAAQSYGDFEVLMVDDGSTDGSAVVCRQWMQRDARFRLISKANGGQSSARNAGMVVAHGKYIAFIDSDDLIHPDYLATLVELAELHDCDMACVGMKSFEHQPPQSKRGIVTGVCSIQPPSEAILGMLYQKTGTIDSSAWGKLIVRSLIGTNAFEEGILYEDLEWMARVLEQMPNSARVCIGDARLYYYRRRGDSTMGTFTPRRLDVLEVTRQIEERAAASGERRRLRAARDRRLSANFDMYLQMHMAMRRRPAEGGSRNSAEGGSLEAAPDYREQMADCWRQIRRLRLGSLLDPHVRLKSRLGAALSLLGPTITAAIGSLLLHRLKR